MSVIDVESAKLPTVDKVNKPWQFKPGQSGNPVGRPKTVGQIRDLARRNTRPAFATILRLMRDKSAPHGTRLAAAQEVLDRAYGKAPQKYEVEVSIFDSLSPEQRMYLDAILQRVIDEQAQAPVIDVTPSAG